MVFEIVCLNNFKCPSQIFLVIEGFLPHVCLDEMGCAYMLSFCVWSVLHEIGHFEHWMKTMEFNYKNIVAVIQNIHQNDFSTTFLSTIACESSKLPFFLCDTLGPQLSHLCIKCIQRHQLIDYWLLPIIVLILDKSKEKLCVNVNA